MFKKSHILLMLIALASIIFGFIAEEKVLDFSSSDIKGGVEEEINANSYEVDIADNELFFNVPKKCPAHTYIKVYKKQRILELYGDDILFGRFRIALGSSPVGDKAREGDSKTPEGRYYICTRNENSRFTLFLGLSFPNSEDAALGLKNNIIDKEEFSLIKTAEEKQQRPPWNTGLGGEIGIHGGGNTFDWTQGCIALSDDDIKLVAKYVTFKTTVLIYD